MFGPLSDAGALLVGLLGRRIDAVSKRTAWTAIVAGLGSTPLPTGTDGLRANRSTP